jgi:hypothetical protein
MTAELYRAVTLIGYIVTLHGDVVSVISQIGLHKKSSMSWVS